MEDPLTTGLREESLALLSRRTPGQEYLVEEFMRLNLFLLEEALEVHHPRLTDLIDQLKLMGLLE